MIQSDSHLQTQVHCPFHLEEDRVADHLDHLADSDQKFAHDCQTSP